MMLTLDLYSRYGQCALPIRMTPPPPCFLFLRTVVIYYPIGYTCFMGFVLPHHAHLFFIVPLVQLISGFRSADAAAVFFPYGLVQ